MIMFSWNLWRSLQNPPLKHPIFRRANMPTSTYAVKSRRFPVVSALLSLLVLIVAAKMLQLNVLIVLVSLPILLIMLMMASPFLLPFVIFGFGVYVATRISHIVFMEKQHATYDLLHLPPIPTIRIDWTLATGVLYRGHVFELLNNAVQFTLFGAGIVVFIIIAIFWATGNAIIVPELINIVVILALFYTGYIQSIVLSLILGLLVPQYAANVEQNTFNAAFAYIMIQCGTYLLALLLSFGLLPMLYNQLHIQHPWADMSLLLWCSILIYGSREWAIVSLWRYLVYRLNSDAV
jgi:hypothetical protein